MKVWELIEKLSALENKDAEVVLLSDHPASAGCEAVVHDVKAYDLHWYQSSWKVSDVNNFLAQEGKGGVATALARDAVPVVELVTGEFLDNVKRP